MQIRSSKKGQIVIPAAIRKRYGIAAGTKLEIIAREDVIELRPLTPVSIRAVRGSLPGHGQSLQQLLKDRQDERKR